jgi:hypothetical protein
VTTVTVSPPPPAPGVQVFRYSGHGTQVTPSFDVPSTGDYTVTWSFSGNSDGYGNGGNFIAQLTQPGVIGAMGLPNDIASSGHGSTEVDGDPSASEAFNVQSEDSSSWTVTVASAA